MYKCSHITFIIYISRLISYVDAFASEPGLILRQTIACLKFVMDMKKHMRIYSLARYSIRKL
jgi:hypothetical protein